MEKREREQTAHCGAQEKWWWSRVLLYTIVKTFSLPVTFTLFALCLVISSVIIVHYLLPHSYTYVLKLARHIKIARMRVNEIEIDRENKRNEDEINSR